MRNNVVLKIIIVFIAILTSCKVEEKEKVEKERLSLIYVILDKSSNSFSASGGIEENYIDIDTIYIRDFVNILFYNNERNESNLSIVLFFNYIDKNGEGNKELFLKLQPLNTIDTVYKPESGVIISSEKEFYKQVQLVKELRIKRISNYKKNSNNVLIEMQRMLDKSKTTTGSDCSMALMTADNKLNNYYIDTTKYSIDKKLIIAFSDLVNHPRNDEKVNLNNFIVRPGYTSKIPYLNNNQIS